MHNNIAGVVLAGGRSSRMGQNKALLDYHGLPLIEHMMALLQQSGLQNIYISGDLDSYECIPDNADFPGPAKAMSHVMRSSTLKAFRSFLFVPVDMPFLTPEILRQLMQHNKGAYFEKWPLPAFMPSLQQDNENVSVKGLLQNMKIPALPLPAEQEQYFVNLNTPEDYKERITG